MTDSLPERLILTPKQVTRIVGHARDERPNEACGLLGGQGRRAEKVYPLPNAEESPVRYLAEPQAQVDAMMEIEERGWGIVGIYHSHLDALAFPSATDLEMAYYPNSIYLIVSLADPEQPVLRAFHIRDDRVEEIGVQIEER